MSALDELLAAPQPIRVTEIGEARTPANVWRQCRFFLTNDHALVYVDSGGKPTLVAEAEIVGFDPPAQPRQPYVVRTADGETWHLTATGNCGCGSSIKSFSPFGYPRTAGT